MLLPPGVHEGRGYVHGETNDLISNFKKTVDRRDKPEWHYKEQALRRIAAELQGAIRPGFLHSATLVPMPPSKSRTDPLYDDRMLRVLQQMATGRPLDIRELLLQRQSSGAFHESGELRDPARIEANYRIDEGVANPAPRSIALFDDLITTGAHFRAANAVLSRRFPGVRVVGIFVARRIFPDDLDDA